MQRTGSETGSLEPRDFAMLTSQQRGQVRRWLEREWDRARRAADRAEEDAGDLLRRKGERDPCAYLGPTAAQEEIDLASYTRRASVSVRRIRTIEEALRRLGDEPEQFGACDSCESAISMERLEVIPYARTCSSCAGRVSEA